MDSFSFKCRGCVKMKELQVELVQLLVVAMVGREQVVCASGSNGGTVDDKVGEDDERDARESSPQPWRRLRGGKVTGRRETGRKETGCKEMGRKEMGRKETGRKETGGKTTGAKERGVGETGAKETGGKETRMKPIRVRETGGKVSGAKATGAQVSQEMGGKGDRLMGVREIDNSLPGDKAAGQNID